MTLWDDRILEYALNNEGASVGEMADSDVIRVSQPHVSRRCNKLAENGLLRALGNGVYVITEEGKRYLKGEIDAGTLREVDRDDSEEDGSVGVGDV
jgi:Mn-dependent DtxR family transcriptional regulator